ncbi:alpha/beta fold hydrolase [Clostridium estertheticum]|uniref:Alpha/beta hydrolase n=1 Tax=Clostridium estertheticum TaxID=238834 RepID=A0AA47EHI7_9CLOT|nr:alpha/beta hydrolase [Clostridium estertheticum]MBU3155268.1 alpha/beta hydrolase [Clostridium estertheticum]WAG60328.1 alpha/beta hydrolase [Clostridium estertheticum]
MIFKEFGNKSMPVIIFLHGGGLSWWSWKPQIEVLQKKYYVVTPIIDGQGDAFDTPFVSIKKSGEQVIKYIKDNCNGKVFAICGLSIGAQITVEILSREKDITDNAVIESALVYPMKLACSLTVPMYNICYGLLKKRWFAKLQAKSLNVPDNLFETYYEESSKITKESLINITKSNGNYPMPLTLCNTKAKVLILVGEKELSIMKKSASLLHETINGSFLKVIGKSRHGEISLIYPEKYLDLLQQLFSSNNEK